MIFEAKKWTEDEGGCVIPDEDGFVTECLAHPMPKPSTIRGTFCFVDKAKIKEQLKRSPDEFDAWVLTFAEPVPSRAVSKQMNEQRGMAGGLVYQESSVGGSKTMNRFRERRGYR